VLIHGGSGGVGHFAVQLAKAKGARVIATASASHLAFLKELGADEAIDYKAQKFEEIVKDADVVFDTIGGDTQARSYAVLKPGGYLASIVEAPNEAKLTERKIRGSVMRAKPDAAELKEIISLVDTGKVKPEVSVTLKLDEAAKAHELERDTHL